MAVDQAEQQRFATRYAEIMEQRRALITGRARDETLRHLRGERYAELPGYPPSEDGSLEARAARVEQSLQRFFTADFQEELEDERLKQEAENLRHRLAMADAEVRESLGRIEQLRRATQSLDEHPDLLKADADLAPLLRLRDKLKAKLEAGRSRNPEAEFRRPFSASHFRV